MTSYNYHGCPQSTKHIYDYSCKEINSIILITQKEVCMLMVINKSTVKWETLFKLCLNALSALNSSSFSFLLFLLPVLFPPPAAPLKVGDPILYIFSLFPFSVTTSSRLHGSEFMVRNTKCEIRFYWGARDQREKCEAQPSFSWNQN